MQLAIPNIRTRILEGGTLRDFTGILLAVAVVVLLAVVLHTCIRAAFFKRSNVVDSSTAHLIKHPEDVKSTNGNVKDIEHGEAEGTVNRSGSSQSDSLSQSSGNGKDGVMRNGEQAAPPMFVPPEVQQDMKH